MYSKDKMLFLINHFLYLQGKAANNNMGRTWNNQLQTFVFVTLNQIIIQ